MWRRFGLTLYLLGMIVAPACAQQAGTASEQKLRQEIEAVFTDWLAVFNKGDGKAAAAFFLPGAPAINPGGMVAGDSQEYANRIVQQHQRNVTTTATVERVQATGTTAAYATGSFTATFGQGNQPPLQGNWLQIYERRGDAWKISASSFAQARAARAPAK
jgi:ketosteroid isomerase-like protein